MDSLQVKQAPSHTPLSPYFMDSLQVTQAPSSIYLACKPHMHPYLLISSLTCTCISIFSISLARLAIYPWEHMSDSGWQKQRRNDFLKVASVMLHDAFEGTHEVPPVRSGLHKGSDVAPIGPPNLSLLVA